MRHRLFRAAAALLAVISLVACHRRPLYELNESIKLIVEVDTDNIKNVTSDIYNPAIPVPNVSTDMLRVMVYDPDNGKLLTQSFMPDKTKNAKGHEVFTSTLKMGLGDFDFLVYNFDTPDTQISGEDNQGTITASTNEIPASLRANLMQTKATDFNALKIYYEPDHLFVAREPGVELVISDELKVVETTAYTVIDTYYIQVHVEGLKNVSTASAVISGVAPSNQFGPNTRTNSPSGVYFNLVKSTDPKIEGENKDVLCAVFNTFGKLDVTSDALFTVNVADTKGKVHKVEINLDEVFKSENAVKHNWLLLDDTLVIPDPETPGTSGGGFQPTVEDWEQEEGGIEL